MLISYYTLTSCRSFYTAQSLLLRSKKTNHVQSTGYYTWIMCGYIPNKHYCAEIKSFSKFTQSLRGRDNVYTSKTFLQNIWTFSNFCLLNLHIKQVVIILTFVYLCSLNSSSYFSLILLYFDVDGWVTTWCSNCCGTITKKLIQNISAIILEFFHDGGPYHIETSTLICKTNQWTGFYMIGTSIVKELNCKKNWVQILLAIGNTHEILWSPLSKKHLRVQNPQ